MIQHSHMIPASSGGMNSPFLASPSTTPLASLAAFSLSAAFLSSSSIPFSAASLAALSAASSASAFNSSLDFPLSASFLASSAFFASAFSLRAAFFAVSLEASSSADACGSSPEASLKSRTSGLISPLATLSSNDLFSCALMNHLCLRLFSDHYTDFLVSIVSSVSSSESAK